MRTPDFGVMFQELTQFFDTSARSFTDVLNFRRINETGAAPLMVCHATDGQIAAIRAANERIGTALTAAEAAQADYDFHYGLVLAANNEVLKRMYDVLATPLRYYLEVGKTQKQDTDKSMADHDRIIDALVAPRRQRAQCRAVRPFPAFGRGAGQLAGIARLPPRADLDLAGTGTNTLDPRQ